MKHLFLAYAVIWVSLAAYLWFMASKQGALRREVQDLKKVLDERKRKPVTEMESK